MSTYRTLKGYNIKSFTTNPTNLKEGQIWYNSTQGGVKVSPNVTAGAWSSGANIPKVFQQLLICVLPTLTSDKDII